MPVPDWHRAELDYRLDHASPELCLTPEVAFVRKYGTIGGVWIGAMELRFTWDPKKAASNARKHGVTFVEAMSALPDPLSITIPDPDHSVGELRYLLIGRSGPQRLLVVAHTERDYQIRIINARTATRAERQTHEEA